MNSQVSFKLQLLTYIECINLSLERCAAGLHVGGVKGGGVACGGSADGAVAQGGEGCGGVPICRANTGGVQGLQSLLEHSGSLCLFPVHGLGPAGHPISHP